jgi:F-type H+-transporting ATPase subunit epsilon
MQLRILVPSKVFGEVDGVNRIVAESRNGSFGLLPHRLDCVAALAPGIMTYATATGEEVYIAVDEGVLVKTGAQVLVSVRRAISGANLGELRKTIENEFIKMDERQQGAHIALSKLESGLIRRFVEFHHE